MKDKRPEDLSREQADSPADADVMAKTDSPINIVDEHTAVLTIDRNLCARYGLGETTDDDGPKLDALLGNLCMVLRDLTGSKVH